MKAVFDDALKGVYRVVEVVAPSEETVDYKQIATLGVGSLVAAIVSILGFFWTPFILVAVVGVVLGVLGLRKIARAPEEIGGFTLTSTATALSVLLAISATFTVLVGQIVTVAFFFISIMAAGLPTTRLRPMTTAFLPLQSMP